MPGQRSASSTVAARALTAVRCERSEPGLDRGEAGGVIYGYLLARVWRQEGMKEGVCPGRCVQRKSFGLGRCRR